MIKYTQEMKFGSMNDFHGNASGSLIANIHNPTWPAYLSNGLLYTNKIGYPSDYGARLAFCMSYIYMLGAIFALGYSFKGYLTGLLSCILPFVCIAFSHIVLGSTRDGFRIIPLVIFCIIIGEKPQRKLLLSWLPILVGYTIMAGHPINAITASVIAVAFIIWYFVTKRGSLSSLICFLIPFGIGAVLGSIQIIHAYFELGSFTDGLTDYKKMFIGTSYYTTYVNNFHNSFGENVGWIRRFVKIFMNDHGIVFIPALLCSIYKCFKVIKRHETKSKEIIIILTVILHIIMIGNIFNWSGESLSSWAYRNFRYLIHLYIFYALIIGVFIDDLLCGLTQRNNSPLSIIDIEDIIISFSSRSVSILNPICVFIICLYLWIPINNLEMRVKTPPREQIPEYYNTINETVESIKPNKMLLDNYNMNYYLKNQGISFWSNPMDSLRHAMTDRDFYLAAQKSNISSILITNSFWDIYWKNTELDHFLSSEYIDREIHIGKHKIYMLK